MKGPQASALESRATEVYEENLKKVRDQLMEEAQPLCFQASATALPPSRSINQSSLLIDETKIYPWLPSHCPEALRPSWVEKKNTYLKSGRWEMSATHNTCQMLLLPRSGNLPKLRVVMDLRKRNKNTWKLSSPMSDMDDILQRVAGKKYRSIINGQDAYEQIRIIPEPVPRMTVTTPDKNMVSLIVQQGNCNAPATRRS